jgi:parallel beta helix pectate lyase-like protein
VTLTIPPRQAGDPGHLQDHTDIVTEVNRLDDAKVDSAKLPVLVRDYATGDGTTDDTTAIVTADADAAAQGRALDFGGPENVYLISAKINVGDNRRWIGQGATIKASAGFGLAAVTEITGSHDISITGIRIDGNRDSGNQAGGLIVCGATSVTRLRIDVDLFNGRLYGMQLAGPAPSYWDVTARINDCGGSGISVQAPAGSNMVFHDLKIHDVGAHGFQINGGAPASSPRYSNVHLIDSQIRADNTVGCPVEINDVQGLVVSNVVVSGSGLRGLSLGNLYDSVIIGNTIRGQTLYGIEANRLFRTNIVGNWIYDCDSGIGGTAPNGDVLISGNVFHSTHPAAAVPNGIYLVSGGPTSDQCYRIHITNNTFTNIAGTGVRLSGTPSEVVVDNNRFTTTTDAVLVSGGSPIAVMVDGWLSGQVQNNRIVTGVAGAGGPTVGAIYVINTASDVVIKGNRIRGVGGPLSLSGVAVQAVATTKLRIEDNDISGLTDGIRTVLSLSDDTVVLHNHATGTTTPYTLKSTHRRSTIEWYEGTGSPEGVVTAAAPAVYVRTDGAAGLTLYVKTTGTGNTGWTAAGGAAGASTGFDMSLLTTGEETIPRLLVPFGNSSFYVGMASGDVRGAQFTARKTETITQVRVITGGTAAAATPTLCKVGVYSVAANGDHTLVASTASDTTLFAAANTAYTRSFTAGFTKTAGQRYAVVVLVVTSGTMPTFVGITGGTEIGAAPSLASRITGQTDLPSSIAAGSLVANSTPLYAVLLP